MRCRIASSRFVSGSTMKLSHAIIALVASSAILCFADNELTAQDKAGGWKLLFDGKDASAHFRGYNSKVLSEGWIVRDGALVRTGGGDVITREKYDSFELTLDWKIGKGGNSGVMFKVLETAGAPYETGPECQILDNKDGTDPNKAGWMYALYPAAVDTTKPAGEWNTLVIKCQKTVAGTYRCQHHLNGTLYVTYEIGSADWIEKVSKTKFAGWKDFGKAAAGHICLQSHGDEVAFRNLKIRVLPELK